MPSCARRRVFRARNASLALLIIAGACWRAPAEPTSPVADAATGPTQDQINDIGWRIRALNHTLAELRPQMCAELGKPVPPAPHAKCPRTTTSERMRSCDAGDRRACFQVGLEVENGARVDDDGGTSRPAKDVPAAIALYRKACEADFHDACLWLTNALRSQGDRAGVVALVTQLIAAGRVELAADLSWDLTDAERKPIESALDGMRDTLETRCHAGSGTACLSRARLECDRTGRCDAREVPWLVRACFGGSDMACGLAAHVIIDPSAARDTRDTLKRACRGNECHGVLDALAASCQRGAWTSCYLTANACKAEEDPCPGT